MPEEDIFYDLYFINTMKNFLLVDHEPLTGKRQLNNYLGGEWEFWKVDASEYSDVVREIDSRGERVDAALVHSGLLPDWEGMTRVDIIRDLIGREAKIAFYTGFAKENDWDEARRFGIELYVTIRTTFEEMVSYLVPEEEVGKREAWK